MTTVRIKFKKMGLSSYYSQLDLQRVMARALKKSGLPVWYSLGFNPHIYMTFTLPLSLGQESVCESVDFRLVEEKTEKEIITAMENTLPDGIEIISAGEVDYLAKDIAFAKYKTTIYDDKNKIISALDQYDKLQVAAVTKKTKRGTSDINLKELIKDIKILDTQDNLVAFEAIYPAGLPVNINPALLLDFLNSTYDISVINSDIIREQILNKNLEILQ